MKRKVLIILLMAMMPVWLDAKMLVVYYSFTNNTLTIVTDLLTQIEADAVRIKSVEKGLDYDVSGRLVAEGAGLSIPVPASAKGVYMVRICQGNKERSVKVSI